MNRSGPAVHRGGKGAVRATVRVSTRQTHAPRVAQKGVTFRDPTLCSGCGAVYTRRTWRVRPRLSRELMQAAVWDTCPACRQVARGISFGRVEVPGVAGTAREADVRRRVANVARRARTTQPERRLVAIESAGASIRVTTTSQKLAHRIARELCKAFTGEASYHWSGEDGSLLARVSLREEAGW